MTTNNHVTCATARFASTDCQTGGGCTGATNKWFESCATSGCASGTTINTGTITAFNSSTDVTVSITAGTTYTNTKLAFGTDDDAAMQLWAAAVVAAPVLGTPALARGGYLPQGGFAIKQPLQFQYPLTCITSTGIGSDATCGEGGPSQNFTAGLSPGLWIEGQSTSASFIYVRTSSVFTWPTSGNNIGAFYTNGWSFSNLSNFALMADQSVQATTGSTQVVAGMLLDNSSHNQIDGLWIQGFHNAAGGLCGFSTFETDFESKYKNSAFEANDFNGCFGNSNTGSPSGKTMEKIQIDTVYFENPGAGINVVFGTSNAGSSINLKQISVTNSSTWNGGTSVRFVSTVTPNGETVQFFNFRQNWTFAGSTANIGFRLDAASTTAVDLHGSYLEDTTSNAGAVLVSNLGSGTVNFYGGQLYCPSCTNLFNNAGNIFVYGTRLNSGPSVANIQTGAGHTYAFIPVLGANGGWTGSGTLQSTQYISNQGVACTNGELALSAGWQSTGSATVTAAAGTGQTCSWTITTGTTTAANPTVTDTLTNVLPTATIVCELNIHGGTHVGAAGEGFTQTTFSATAPIFTADFTPTAGGTTYLVTRRCGP